jgi:hypothetical protein
LCAFVHCPCASIPVSLGSNIKVSRKAAKLYINDEYIPEGVSLQGSHPTEAQTIEISESSVKGRSQNDDDKMPRAVDTQVKEYSVEANRWVKEILVNRLKSVGLGWLLHIFDVRRIH